MIIIMQSNTVLPIYSFIIPHKNCPHLLNRCLESIPQRDDVQIIVVDDNSDSDKKPVILRENVDLILLNESQSRGAGRARNVGMHEAKGKWLLFADADDCYTDKIPSLLDKYAKDDTTDIVYLNAYLFDDKGNTCPFRSEKLLNDFLLGKKNSEKALRYGIWTPWTRMIKREVIIKNHLLFEESMVGNDIVFGLYSSMYSRTISAEKEMIYKYYKWPHGSVSQNISKDLVDDLIINRGKLIRFHNQVGYHSNLNLLSVIEGLFRNRKLSLKQALSYYVYYLKEFHVNGAKDMTRYFDQLFLHRIPHKLLHIAR